MGAGLSARRRGRRARTAAVLALAAGLGGSGAAADGTGASPDGIPQAAVWERQARAALAPFQRALQAALRDGLAHGPAAAVEACKLEAPALAEHASGDGIRVGRTSDRLRQPRNAAPEWAVPLLAEALAAPAEAGPRLVATPDGGLGYVEPIRVQPLCLTCHGEVIPAEVEARLDALYPADRAVGYAVGDLRGLFWVEIAPARVARGPAASGDERHEDSP